MGTSHMLWHGSTEEGPAADRQAADRQADQPADHYSAAWRYTTLHLVNLLKRRCLQTLQITLQRLRLQRSAAQCGSQLHFGDFWGCPAPPPVTPIVSCCSKSVAPKIFGIVFSGVSTSKCRQGPVNIPTMSPVTTVSDEKVFHSCFHGIKEYISTSPTKIFHTSFYVYRKNIPGSVGVDT